MSRILPTIHAPDLLRHRAALLAKARPAVLRGLFDGQKLGTLTDIARVREALGTTPVMISRNYTDSHRQNIRNYVQGVNAPPQIERKPGTLADYLDLIAREPDTRWLITEQAAPADLLASVDLSALGVTTLIGGYGNPAAPPSTTTAHSLMFAANRDNASDLHTDWDGRDVILYQLFGRKRVVLFPPEAAPKLHPIDIFATVRLSGLDDSERAALCSFAGGVEHLLQPGEAMFIPAFWWHHIDYLDAAMSISFRLGGVQDPDALALLRSAHRDWRIQNIVAGSRDPQRSEACRAAARTLLAAGAQPSPTALEKYRAMRALAAECHRATLPAGSAPPVDAVIEAEDFLDGALCAFYRRPTAQSTLGKRLWSMREGLRDTLRRTGRKLAYWA